MQVTLTPRAEELLGSLIAHHPDQSPAQIIENALAAYFERELGQPVTGPLILELR